MTLNTQRLFSVVRQIASVAGMVVALVPQVPMPTTVRAVLVFAGGLILAVEHYVADPSTGTTSASKPGVPPPPGS